MRTKRWYKINPLGHMEQWSGCRVDFGRRVLIVGFGFGRPWLWKPWFKYHEGYRTVMWGLWGVEWATGRKVKK